MKKVGFVFIGLAVVLFILHFILSGPTYTNLHTGLPIAASFVLGAGIGLFLAGFNIERQEKKRRRDTSQNL